MITFTYAEVGILMVLELISIAAAVWAIRSKRAG